MDIGMPVTISSSSRTKMMSAVMASDVDAFLQRVGSELVDVSSRSLLDVRDLVVRQFAGAPVAPRTCRKRKHIS